MTPPPPSPRILLCASAAHCAQILHAAAATRIALHGLIPATAWPTAPAPGTLVLWALLPPSQTTAQTALEQRWRSHLLHGGHGCTIHMLYGQAPQQAAQLAPWTPTPAPDTAHTSAADCWECLDAASEHQLFQHLLQRK